MSAFWAGILFGTIIFAAAAVIVILIAWWISDTDKDDENE